jgi:CPA2 family monovalent cation:H+ antiporter-2
MLTLWTLANEGGAASEMARGATLDLLIVLAAAALVTMSLHRIRLAAIPGYLITGAIIGPFALGLIHSDENIEQIKGLSTVLLMFIIGLHLDLSSIRSSLAAMLAVGAISTVLVVALLWPVAIVLGAPAPAALVLAMAVSMSSTAVGLRLMQQRREMHRLHGRLVVGISIVQDLLSLVVLAVLPLIAVWAGKDGAQSPMAGGIWHLAKAGGIALLGIAGLIGFGRYILPRMLGEAAREQSGESSLVLTAAVALGAAVLTAWLGFSPELGAFMAGFLLASTPFRYQLAGQLAPLRDLLMAIFFTTVGLKLDMHMVLGGWWVVLLGLAAVVIVKTLVIGVCIWAAGATTSVASRAALTLANAGEFSLVILALSEKSGVTTPELDGLAIAIVVLSLILTPSLVSLSDRINPWIQRLPTAPWLKRSSLREQAAPHPDPTAAPDPAEATPADQPQPSPDALPASAPAGGTPTATHAHPPHPPHRRAVIAGFGVVGRAVADHLEVHRVPYTVVELNPMTVQTQQRLGRRAVYGDIGNPAVLEALGIEHCDAVFLTVPDDDAILRACQAIRNLAPHVHIVARTSFLATAFQATSAGADDVSIAEVAVAEDMVKRVLKRLKVASAQG